MIPMNLNKTANESSNNDNDSDLLRAITQQFIRTFENESNIISKKSISQEVLTVLNKLADNDIPEKDMTITKRQFKTFTRNIKETVSKTYIDEAIDLFQLDKFIVNKYNEQQTEELMRKFFLKKMLEIIDIHYTHLNELFGVEISRDILLCKSTIDTFLQYKEPLKSVYHSDMLSCLHNNSQSKQRFPAICMMRQILKAQNLKLKPKVRSEGYNKTTGKKEVSRHFIICLLSDTNAIHNQNVLLNKKESDDNMNQFDKEEEEEETEQETEQEETEQESEQEETEQETEQEETEQETEQEETE